VGWIKINVSGEAVLNQAPFGRLEHVPREGEEEHGQHRRAERTTPPRPAWHAVVAIEILWSGGRRRWRRCGESTARLNGVGAQLTSDMAAVATALIGAVHRRFIIQKGHEHTHRELIRKWLWEPKGSSLEYI